MNVHRFCLFILSFLFALQNSNAQTWQLANPTDGAPGFMPGYGENIYVGGENDPGLRLTRTATAVRPTVVLSDTTYPGRSTKESPLIARSNDGSALVFWYDKDNDINAQNKARKVDANGVPQGNEIILSLTPSDNILWYAPAWTLASNGEQIVLTWEYLGDIFYQLYNFDGIPLTIVKQANQDTIVIDPVFGEWNPSAFTPSADMRNDGSFIIAWQDNRKAETRVYDDVITSGGDTGEIYARSFNSLGEPTGDNFKINQDLMPAVETKPSICINDSGTIFCYWQERDTTFTDNFYNMIGGRIIGKDFSYNLKENSKDHYNETPIVTASDSGFAVIWRQEGDLYIKTFNQKGEVKGKRLKVTDNKISNYLVRTMENQLYSIIWNIYDSAIIQGCVFNPFNGNLGDVQNILSGLSIITDIYVDKKGTGVSYINDSSTSVNTITFNENLELQYHTERLNTDTGGAEHKKPLGEQLPNGNYITLWLDTRSGITQIYGQIFNSDAEKIGENFLIDIPFEYKYYDDQSFSLIVLPINGPLLAYSRNEITNDYNTKYLAFLQRLTADGELLGSPVQINDITNFSTESLKITLMPTNPYFVLATWIQNKKLFAKLFDNNLNSLVNTQQIDIPHYTYNLGADSQNRFWLLGIDNTTYNLYLGGYNTNLQQLTGTIQLNDTSMVVYPYYNPQLNILPNGKMLAVWAQKSEWENRIKDLYAQLLDDQGKKIGNNFRVSSCMSDKESSNLVDEFYCTTIDSLFVITWNNWADRTRDESHIVKIDQFGKLAESPTTITNNERINYQKIFVQERDRYLSLQQIPGNPNETDISINIHELTDLNTSGFYNSPVFLNEDTLIWKKLSWLNDVPDNTSVKVFFRCKDNLWNEDDKYIPWQQIENGQTENLPAGKRAQWRVELTGTESVSPIVYDLIGEYERKTGIEKTTDAVPYSYRLDPVYPNPANNRVTISYELAAPAKATIAIYNILGQRINQWQLAQEPAGRHTWHWNGETMFGARVASGIYFITLEANSFRATRKVVLMQ